MKSRVLALAVTATTLTVLLPACGSSGTTTVTEAATEATTETTAPTEVAAEKRIAKIEAETQEAELEAAQAKKEAAQAAARAKMVAAKHARQAAARNVAAEEAQAEAEESSSSEPPNVIGMKLPEAEAELSSGGFHTVAENTDTAFGIVVKSHYTICEETPLGGDNVRVLAQKYGC